MENSKVFGEMFREFITRAGLSSLEELAHEVTLFLEGLPDNEIEMLETLGAEPYIGVGKTTYSRYQTGVNTPKRDRVLTLIYFFSVKGAIQFDQANQWIEYAGWARLSSKELQCLFGDEGNLSVNDTVGIDIPFDEDLINELHNLVHAVMKKRNSSDAGVGQEIATELLRDMSKNIEEGGDFRTFNPNTGIIKDISILPEES